MVKLRLKEIFNNKGFTQARVARELGVTAMTVSGWITGKRYPTIEVLDRLADILGVRIVDFFADVPSPHTEVVLQARCGDTTVELTPALIQSLAAVSKA